LRLKLGESWNMQLRVPYVGINAVANMMFQLYSRHNFCNKGLIFKIKPKLYMYGPRVYPPPPPPPPSTVTNSGGALSRMDYISKNILLALCLYGILQVLLLKTYALDKVYLL